MDKRDTGFPYLFNYLYIGIYYPTFAHVFPLSLLIWYVLLSIFKANQVDGDVNNNPKPLPNGGLTNEYFNAPASYAHPLYIDIVDG